MSIQVTTPEGKERGPASDDGNGVVWLDIDNSLYSKDCGIAEMMKEKIQLYFLQLGLPKEEAKSLHHHYYTEYGLAIRGLVRHHHVDPLDYDAKCDAALPLEKVLKPDLELRNLLKRFDRSKVRVWALTNAYVNHAVRVLALLGLNDQFEGIVSCNYGAQDFSCKPEAAFFNEAIIAGGQPDPQLNYFVDDSALNIKGAHALGWGHSVLFDEHGDEAVKLGGLDKLEMGDKGRISVIRDMQDLATVWKGIFLQMEPDP